MILVGVNMHQGILTFRLIFRLLNGKFKKPRKGKNNDKAHPPIHPVRGATNLEGDDKRVFEFITRRFLACCSNAAKGQSTNVSLEISKENFTTSGIYVLQ